MKHMIKIQATVTVKDKNGKILAQAKSRPNNLILDNFGLWLAAFIRTPVIADTSVVLQDVVPSAQTFPILVKTSPLFNYCNAQALGTQVQVGSGTTPAARTDSHVQTAFGTAPESGRFVTGNGSYFGGIITFSGSITAGGAGTINEAGFFAVWLNSASAAKTVMLFHDILTVGVPFVAGNIILVSYAIQL